MTHCQKIFRILILLAASVAAAPTHAAPPQGLGFIAPNQKSPIAIEADNGLEWRRKDNVYIARGNAKATSGDMIVMADELRGYYRGGESGGKFELFKLEAIGQVTIQSGPSRAIADQAFYDLDQSIFVMTGKDMRLASNDMTVTAGERIEFWQAKNLAVARGNAVAKQGQNKIQAETLSAHFGQGNNQKLSIERVDASGGVKIQSEQNLGQAQSATYDLSRGIATLKGNVKLTQGPNQLNGEYAEMNLKTGVSKLLGGQDGGTGIKRVRAMVIPPKAKTPENF